MGAWAEDTFGNDAACDWTGSFLQKPSLAAVQATLSAVLAEDEYLESGYGSGGLAACEVIARLQGRWGLRNPYSKELDQWIEANPQEVPEELKETAIAVIDRILGHDSELRELWDEGGRNEQWHREVDELRARVSG